MLEKENTGLINVYSEIKHLQPLDAYYGLYIHPNASVLCFTRLRRICDSLAFMRRL